MKKRQKRILAIIRKEYLHIIHDPRTLVIVFLMPIVQLTMFGYALNMEIQRIDMAVVDYSNSPSSRNLIEEFMGSTFFNLFYHEGKHSEIETLFKTRKAKVALVIPQDFDKQLLRKMSIPIQFLIDASDPNAATLIKNDCNQIIVNFNLKSGNKITLPFEIANTINFNPNLKSSHFFVPGLIALILIMISALLTSVTIAREKETGTMEQILVSPVRPREIIIGKVLPYIFLAFLDGALILTIAVFIFQVPFEGSMVLLILLSILYIITALSMGLFISTVAPSQQVAMMMALIATLLPTIMLSGLIFPIASMPKLLQYITHIIPARFYLLIVRGILLKGSTFFQLITPSIILAFMSFFLLNVAARKFSMTLEK